MPLIPGPRPVGGSAPKANIPSQTTQDKNKVRSDSHDRLDKKNK